MRSLCDRWRLPRLSLATALACAACGGPAAYKVPGTEQAPDADGWVQVERIEGNSRLVTVVVHNLVPPRRVRPELTTYVVWLDRQGTAKNVGALAYREDHRQGSMYATTGLRDFELKVTAERSAAVSAPSDFVVLRKRLYRE